MTNFSNIFESYSPCAGKKKVRIANGSFSPIVGKGLIKIYEEIDLKFILHVPKLACNSCLLANYLEILIIVSSSMNLVVFSGPKDDW